MFYKLTYKYYIPQLQYQVWFQITKEELRTITLTAGNILTTLAVYKVCTELTGLFSGTCTTFCCHPQKQPPFQGYRLDRPMAPFQEVGSLHSCSTQIAENFSEMHLHSLCQSKGKNVIQLSKTSKINYIFAFVCFVFCKQLFKSKKDANDYFVWTGLQSIIWNMYYLLQPLVDLELLFTYSSKLLCSLVQHCCKGLSGHSWSCCLHSLKGMEEILVEQCLCLHGSGPVTTLYKVTDFGSPFLVAMFACKHRNVKIITAWEHMKGKSITWNQSNVLY